MKRPRSRPVIVATLAVAHPVFVIGFGAAALLISALLTRNERPDDLIDFDEGGSLIAALVVAFPLALLVAHVAWGLLASMLLPKSHAGHLGWTLALLIVVSVAGPLVTAAGAGPIQFSGMARLVVAGAGMAGAAALGAMWLTRPN